MRREPGERYGSLFQRLARRREAVFVPFVVLGDPDPGSSLAILRTLVEAGADALELGLPFSDPVADGPVIQAAAARALASGVRLRECWRMVRYLRDEWPALPVGLMAYANLAMSRGLPRFCGEAAGAGADSLLIPDLPIEEGSAAAAAALEAGLAPVFLAPSNAAEEAIGRIARAGRGYTYVTARPGVTGESTHVGARTAGLLRRLKAAGAPPAMIGFGIDSPGAVRAAVEAGAAGVISGTAVIRAAGETAGDPARGRDALSAFVRTMKAATRPGAP